MWPQWFKLLASQIGLAVIETLKQQISQFLPYNAVLEKLQREGALILNAKLQFFS